MRKNYIDIVTQVTKQIKAGISSLRLVGVLDDPKMRSSIRFFERITRDGIDPEVNKVCKQALEALEENPE